MGRLYNRQMDHGRLRNLRLVAALGASLTVLILLMIPPVRGVIPVAVNGGRSAAGQDGGDGDPVIAAAGDIACSSSVVTTTECHQRATSDLLVSLPLDAVLSLGDDQYPSGAPFPYETYYDSTWGRVKRITHPAPGNHDYETANATGYYGYFGAAAGDPLTGYYAFNLGAWHIIALNSNCGSVGGCQLGSPQERWLRQDLASDHARCTLAYWHHPRFSSGVVHGNDAEVSPLWQALYDYGADVIMSGHEHNYERFAPQKADGTADPGAGLREFVVGTGGAGHFPFGVPLPNSEVRNSTTFGILKLTLHPTSYDWQFVPEKGGIFTDAGSAACH
jgi:hypothetical protein